MRVVMRFNSRAWFSYSVYIEVGTRSSVFSMNCSGFGVG